MKKLRLFILLLCGRREMIINIVKCLILRSTKHQATHSRVQTQSFQGRIAGKLILRTKADSKHNLKLREIFKFTFPSVFSHCPRDVCRQLRSAMQSGYFFASIKNCFHFQLSALYISSVCRQSRSLCIFIAILLLLAVAILPPQRCHFSWFHRKKLKFKWREEKSQKKKNMGINFNNSRNRFVDDENFILSTFHPSSFPPPLTLQSKDVQHSLFHALLTLPPPSPAQISNFRGFSSVCSAWAGWSCYCCAFSIHRIRELVKII